MTRNHLMLGVRPRDADAPGRIESIDDTGTLLQPDDAGRPAHRRLNLTEPGITE